MNRTNILAAIILFIILSAIIVVALLYPPPQPVASPTPTPAPSTNDTPSFGYIPQPTPAPTPNATAQPITTTEYLTVTPSSIYWGTVTGATSRNVTVANTAPVNFTLTMTSTCTVGTLTWNLENTTLPAGATRTATFTLTPAWNATQGSFTFDITINGAET